MEYRFCTFSHAQPALAEKGEIHLRAPGGQERITLAVTALDGGLSAFPHGEGPIERVVIAADPTLDDMLAAGIIERQLGGETLPVGVRTFAVYAANVREGLRATELPLKDALEGMYLAIRTSILGDLGAPENATSFLAAWRKMEQRILAAAREGIDPVSSPLFAHDPEYARDRVFLGQDQAVYQQRDLPRGERWLLRLPGGDGQTIPGLLLRKPASVLWKYWAREDPQALGSKGYLFLAVCEQERRWRFSLSPGYRLSLRPLAETLQQAESAHGAERARQDPWYDGRHHAFTIVAAPLAGSELSDHQVLAIVKAWAHVRVLGASRRRLMIPVAAACLALLAGLLFFFARAQPASPPSPFQVSVWIDGKPQSASSIRREEPARRKQGRFRAGLDVNLHKGNNRLSFVTRSEQGNYPFKLGIAVEAPRQLELSDAKIRINDVWHELKRQPQASNAMKFESEEVSVVLGPGQNNLDVELFGPESAPGQAAGVELHWNVDLEFKRDLYLLAVGVSHLQTPSYRFGDLEDADRDARDIVQALADQEGKLFRKVESASALANEKATKKDILDALDRLGERARRSRWPALVVVAFSGHGLLGKGERFFFLPHDFDPTAEQPEAANALAWDDLVTYLRGVPWPVVVVMDTCHSGKIKTAGGFPARPSATLHQALTWEGKKAHAEAGLVVLAACRSDEQTLEVEDAGNGLLTLALLEGIQGKRRLPTRARTRLPQEVTEGEPITLDDVCRYVELRVQELAGNQAGVLARRDDSLLPVALTLVQGAGR